MEPVCYTVQTINGDYAYLLSDSGVENQVAMFLLPEGTDPHTALDKLRARTWAAASCGRTSSGRCCRGPAPGSPPEERSTVC